MVDSVQEDRPVRILLVGAGRMGLSHLQELLKIPDRTPKVDPKKSSVIGFQKIQTFNKKKSSHWQFSLSATLQAMMKLNT